MMLRRSGLVKWQIKRKNKNTDMAKLGLLGVASNIMKTCYGHMVDFMPKFRRELSVIL